jgi:hypothetical protein
VRGLKDQEGDGEMWINSMTWNAMTFVIMVGDTQRERKNI